MSVYSKKWYPQVTFLILITILIFKQLLPSLSVIADYYPIANQGPIQSLPNKIPMVPVAEHIQDVSSTPGAYSSCSISTVLTRLLSVMIGSLTKESDGTEKMAKSSATCTNQSTINGIDSAKHWKVVADCQFLQLRSKLVDCYLKLLPQPHAGLVVATTLGDKQWLSDRIKPYLETTGTQHLLATSGLHLALLVGLMSRLLFFTRGRPRAVVLWILAVFYLLLVGPRVSLNRAWAMMSMALVAKTWTYRQYHAAYILVLVALILVATDLSILTSVSFQLSYGATLAIILFAKQLGRITRFTQVDALLSDVSAHNQLASQTLSWWSAISGMMLVGVAAQLVTSPLVLWHFGQIPLLAFVPSALLGVIMPLLLGAEIVIGILSLLLTVVPSISLEELRLIQLLSWLPVQLFHISLEEIGQQHWLMIEVKRVPVVIILFWFVGLIVLYKLLQRQSMRQPKPLRSNLSCFESN